MRFYVKAKPRKAPVPEGSFRYKVKAVLIVAAVVVIGVAIRCMM